jgi:hypothetical protein
MQGTSTVKVHVYRGYVIMSTWSAVYMPYNSTLAPQGTLCSLGRPCVVQRSKLYTLNTFTPQNPPGTIYSTTTLRPEYISRSLKPKAYFQWSYRTLDLHEMTWQTSKRQRHSVMHSCLGRTWSPANPSGSTGTRLTPYMSEATARMLVPMSLWPLEWMAAR